jgi:hemolysin activation/secretion protein
MITKNQLVSVTFLSAACISTHAQSAVIPNAADIAHSTTILSEPQYRQSTPASTLETRASTSNAPQGTEQIDITLESITLNGLTAFPKEEIEALYQDHLHKKTKLSTLWDISSAITKHYNDKGYFLSKAFVPQQEFQNGHAIITIVEGYIGDVKLDEKLANNDISKNIAKQLTTQKPINIRDLERATLEMNDSSGENAQATLYALDHAAEGAVGLQFSPSSVHVARGSWLMNNFGSRYTGPIQNTLVYEDNFYKNQKTQIAIQHTIPTGESKYIALRHNIPLNQSTSVSLFSSYIASNPGYTLKPQQIHSKAAEMSADIRHNIIRQLNQNLSITGGISHKIIDTNILRNTDLSHDSLYQARIGFDGDLTDHFGGKNTASLFYTRGIKLFDANEKNSLNSSRIGAIPEFNKFELDLSRQQFISEEFAITLQSKAQYATDTLYSSHEFGFGGQSAGRAYDASEFSGQRGIVGSAELYYYGFASLNEHISPLPFVFYDIATINTPQGANKRVQASSIGFGTKATLYDDFNASFTLAWPLQEDISTPTYGSNRSPRLLVQLGYNF